MNTRYSVVFSLLISTYVSICGVQEESAPTVQESTVTDADPSTPPKKYRRKRAAGAVTRFFTTPYLNIKHMTFDQAMARATELEDQKDLRSTCKYLKHALTQPEATDPDIRADIEIRIAELLFKREKYEKSAQKFRLFSVLYPGNTKHAEYAAWMACKTSQHCLNNFDRCQEQTNVTIRLADEYLGRSLFTTYRNEIQKIRSECYTLLVQSEMNIWSQHITSNNQAGAEIHLAYVEKELSNAYPPALLLADAYKQGYPIDKLPVAKEDIPPFVVAEHTPKKPRMANRF